MNQKSSLAGSSLVAIETNCSINTDTVFKFFNTQAVRSVPSSLGDKILFHNNYPCKDGKKHLDLPCLFFPYKRQNGTIVSYRKLYLDKDFRRASIRKPSRFTKPENSSDLYNSVFVMNDVAESDMLLIAADIETGLVLFEAAPYASIWIVAKLKQNESLIRIPDSVDYVFLVFDENEADKYDDCFVQDAEDFQLISYSSATHECSTWLEFISDWYDEEFLSFVTQDIRLRGHSQSEYERIHGKRLLPEAIKVEDWIHSSPRRLESVLDGAFYERSKVFLIGPSKVGKTYIASQLAYSLATGQDFLEYKIKKKFRTLYLQFELDESSYQERMRNLYKGLELSPMDVNGYLSIINCRGSQFLRGIYEHDGLDIFYDKLFDQIEMLIKESQSEILIIDPIYKILLDESSASAVKPLLAMFDRITSDLGITLIALHHTPKGDLHDKSLIDLGSGSSCLTRDMDCGIFIFKHQEDGLLVMKQISRNNAPRPAFSFAFDGSKFVMNNTPPVIKGKKAIGKTISQKDIIDILQLHPLSTTELKQRLSDKGFSSRHINEVVKAYINDGILLQTRESKRNGKTMLQLSSKKVKLNNN